MLLNDLTGTLSKTKPTLCQLGDRPMWLYPGYMDATDRLFLDFSIRKLGQLAARIEDCLNRLTEEQIWVRGTENENSVGNLALHLNGNVRQWIVSAIGGRPDNRRRDAEFAARGGVTAAELTIGLRETVADAVGVLETLPAARLTERIRPQNYDVAVLEAVYHVVEHFAGHTGQIIYATKLLTGSDLGYYRHLKTTSAHAEQTP
jgi:uncharacterized damage-inducible protein DinB